MKSYLIESLAPLVFRSGKPFGSVMSAQDMIFPLPSAGAGLIRYMGITQSKLPQVHNDLRNTKVDIALQDVEYQCVLATKSYGVYLAKYRSADDVKLYAPKPANSLYVENDEGEIDLIRLSPLAIEETCGSDLPTHLLYVQTVDKDGKPQVIKGKPKSGVNYWLLEDVVKWQKGDDLSYEQISKNGIASIPTEIRTHVAIDDESLGSQAGKLFQTASYDLGYKLNESQNIAERSFDDERLGFVVLSEQDLADDLATFGGERRLSHFKSVSTSLSAENNQTLLDGINKQHGFSLTFITPCIFAQGYLPAWIDKDSMTGTLPNSQVKVRLKAVASERWQAVSGWDSLLWQPKAMRKAVSAGSVYWFELIDEMDLATLQRLQQPLADDGYDQNDGFGMAIVAPHSFN